MAKYFLSAPRNTWLQTFQYLLIHIVSHGNKWLSDEKIMSESGCNFCSTVSNVIYIFIDCENTK